MTTAGNSLTEFTGRVLSVIRRIPPGRVATYGEVAVLAGRPGAARAVGNIMRTSQVPGLPYHRVVAAGGRLGGYGGNELLKRDRLVAEGILFSGTRIRNFAAVSLVADGQISRPRTPAGAGRVRHTALGARSKGRTSVRTKR